MSLLMVQYPIAHSSFHIYFKHFNQNKRLIDSYNLVRYFSMPNYYLVLHLLLILLYVVFHRFKSVIYNHKLMSTGLSYKQSKS